MLHEHHADTFPNLMFLIEKRLILPLHTAQVERGSSSQNNIVTASRNRIPATTVNKLMLVKCEGAALKDYNFNAVLSQCKKKNLFCKEINVCYRKTRIKQVLKQTSDLIYI